MFTCTAGSCPTEHVALEVRGDIDDERVLADVHQAVDVAGRNGVRRLEEWRQERADHLARQHRVIFIDDPDGRVVQLLRVALGLGIHGQGKRVDDERQQHGIVKEAAQLFDAEPEDGREGAH